jgi:hypothetical protein
MIEENLSQDRPHPPSSLISPTASAILVVADVVMQDTFILSSSIQEKMPY